MYKYNTSFSVEQTTVLKWMNFMRDYYIPHINQYEVFKNGTLLRVDAKAQQGYRMFAFQVDVDKLIHIKKWQRQNQLEIDKKIKETFDDKVLCFSSILEEITLK